MWPLDRFAGVDVLRLGAHTVELWRRRGSALEQVTHEPLPRRGSLYDAGASLEPLRSIASQVTGKRVTMVLESAYAPVLLADTGGVLTRPSQIDVLLQHRFGLAYGSPDRAAARWRVRWAHCYGDRYALGYGLPTEVEAALREGTAAAGLAFTAWVPALAWGLERFARRRRTSRCSWWIWKEQDRSLAVHLNGSQVDALDPALLGATTAADIERAVAAVSARAEGAGIQAAFDAASSIGLGHWQAAEGSSGNSTRIQAFVVASTTTDAAGDLGATGALRAAAG